jgi:putative thioredoxin
VLVVMVARVPTTASMGATLPAPDPERVRAGIVAAMALDVVDVTDATFQAEVIDRSRALPVVVDLWAPWCGPCRTLGPIIEKVVGETNGEVALVKVNVDENPAISQAFGVQSIPLVVALKDGQPVDGFVGAHPEPTVREFVERLRPSSEESEVRRLLAAGDEASLRQVLELDPPNEAAIVALAELLVDKGESEEALLLLNRMPETEKVRHVKAAARLATQPADDYDVQLVGLLDRVKDDGEARQQYVDILEVMGPDDPRTASYRKQLTSRLF